MITCPECGEQNQRGADFCRSCGADFPPHRLSSRAKVQQPIPSKQSPSILTKFMNWLTQKDQPSHPRIMPQKNTRPLSKTKRLAARSTTHSLPERLKPLQPGTTLSKPQDPTRRYSILTTHELDHSIYYDAIDLTCPACQAQYQQAPPNGLCQRCHTLMKTTLIHERPINSQSPHSNEAIQQLVRLSANQPNILPHYDIIQYQRRVYTICKHPRRWGVLVRGKRQRSSDEAIGITAQVGQALAYLHVHNLAYAHPSDIGIESIVTTNGGMQALLADLSLCTFHKGNNEQSKQTSIDKDLLFLGKLLYYLTTGEELERSGSIDLAPGSLRSFIEQAVRGQYTSVEAMLEALSHLPSSPKRALKPMHGQATHPGQQYDHNEDAVVTFTFDKEQDERSVPIGFYLVADGMGGHDAGDVASRTVNQIVTNWVINTKVLPNLQKQTRRLTTDDVPSELLTQAIRKANQALLSHGKAKSSDLGSTVTAALIIGSVATIANVGDSRTYLLRAGTLKQITQDHSLVARLVDAGAIEPEEVRSHPQRNQIYRSLGHDQHVKVDTFTQQLQAGDILLLCSDGLWEMVLDDEVQRIIESSSSPQRACDALIAAANHAGGEDNIAVIIVEME